MYDHSCFLSTGSVKLFLMIAVITAFVTCHVSVSHAGGYRSGESGMPDPENMKVKVNGEFLEISIPVIPGGKGSREIKYELKLLRPEGDVVAVKEGEWKVGGKKRTLEVSMHVGEWTGDMEFGRIKWRLESGSLDVTGIVDLGETMSHFDCRLVCDRKLTVGTVSLVKVITVDRLNNPVGDAEFTFYLVGAGKDGKVYAKESGRTDRNGMADIRLKIPLDAPEKCVIRVRSEHDGAVAVAETGVTITLKERVLITTDKPIYQPGQTVHFRALALSPITGLPGAGLKHEWLIEDSRGNKVFRKSMIGDRFGVTSGEFALAPEAVTGAYSISCTIDGKVDASGKRIVKVDRYVLPRFSVEAVTDRKIYIPGDVVRGRVESKYFFGKPVKQGRVSVRASTLLAGKAEIGFAEGTTDDNGSFEFRLSLPPYFTGVPFEGGKAPVFLEARVTDRAGHVERSMVKLIVTGEPVYLALVPEGGVLVKGLVNRLYLYVASPDGTPVQGADVKISMNGRKLDEVVTGKSGVAVFEALVPERDGDTIDFELMVHGETGDGDVTKRVKLKAGERASSLIVRCDRYIARAGDRILVEAIGAPDGRTIYFDGIMGGQTVLSTTSVVKNGTAGVILDLPAAPEGTMIVNGYMITSDADMVGGRAVVCVLPGDELRVGLGAVRKGSDGGKEVEFKPKEEASIEVSVVDADGKPVDASVALAVVDEAVFARKEMYPGFESLFFILEKEILKPRYEIHGASMERVLLPASLSKALDRVEVKETAALVASAASGDSKGAELISSLVTHREMARKVYLENVKKTAEHAVKYIRMLLADRDRKTLRCIDNDVLPLILGSYTSDYEMFLDPWERQVKIECPEGDPAKVNGPGGFTVVSSGPDGLFDSDDDIRVPVSEILKNLLPEVDGAKVMFMARPEAVNMVKPGKSLQPTGEKGPGNAETGTRVYFPETLLFEPALMTGDMGSVSVPIKWADSITDWKVTAFAVDEMGRLGTAVGDIRVFRKFFVDLDLPVILTTGDEVTIPAAIHNYTGKKLGIALKLVLPEGISCDNRFLETSVEPDGVAGVRFPVRFSKPGNWRIKLEAEAGGVTDAVEREITVVPDAKLYEKAVNGVVSSDSGVDLVLPGNAVKGASKLLVKLYPGVFSQVLEGMDSILRMPFGCFEQTSSITYPNVLVLSYMKEASIDNPEAQLKAEQYISLGYQRLLAFEVKGGGFSWFGEPPANGLLTAWGLMEFSDMAVVYPVDEAVLDRSASWLVSRQRMDGSFPPDDNYLHSESWKKLQGSDLLVTAYTLWGLAASGREKIAEEKAVGFLRNRIDEAVQPDVAAISALALIEADAGERIYLPLLERLAASAVRSGDTVHWNAVSGGITFSGGKTADLELTALVTLAFLKTGYRMDLASGGLKYLAEAKDPAGTWNSTHATILALRALVESLGSKQEEGSGRVVVKLDGKEIGSEKFNNENADVVRFISVPLKKRESHLDFDVSGKGTPMFQAVVSCYLPWDEKFSGARVHEPLSVSVYYGSGNIRENDIVNVTVDLKNASGAELKMVVADIGFPPGFDPVPGTLERLVERGRIEKYELTRRGVIFYFDAIPVNAKIKLEFDLVARFPLRAADGGARAYAYYDPDVKGESAPGRVEVDGGS